MFLQLILACPDGSPQEISDYNICHEWFEINDCSDASCSPGTRCGLTSELMAATSINTSAQICDEVNGGAPYPITGIHTLPTAKLCAWCCDHCPPTTTTSTTTTTTGPGIVIRPTLIQFN